MSEMIAEYISRSEYQCRCCSALPPDLKKDENGDYPTVYDALFGRFKDIREAWGKPIPITSGYRCLAHNKAIGGEQGSVHCFGLALDCSVGVDNVEAFAKLVDDTFPEMRMGIYPTQGFVHLDLGFYVYPRYSKDLVESARWEK